MRYKAKMQTSTVKMVGYVAGPVCAALVAIFFNFEGVNLEAKLVAAALCWMAIWWATEAVNVAVTAFIPLVIFPVVGISDISSTAANYANPIIYLFMGGFIMAMAVEKSGLHQRVALFIFQTVGLSARKLVAGFMIAAALISMWISNTSTTIMMLPMATSVVYVIRATVHDLSEAQLRNFEIAILLGLAYGATMGGVATLVGTPPNAFMSGFMEANYGVEVDFARWMIVGLPLTFIMLPIVWFLLVRVLFPVNFNSNQATLQHLETQRKELGVLSQTEKRTACVFLLLILGWMLRKPIAAFTGIDGLSDAGIAMLAALALFLIPSDKPGEALIEWEDTKRLPWGVLVLFGGGLALASGMTSSGLTEWMGQNLAGLSFLHITVLIVVACAMVIFLTELTSNLATTATFLPIMAALALETGHEPLVLIAPITLAASFAFMLPVATPPNAIIFSTGRVSIKTMIRAGLVLNLLGVAVLTAVAVLVIPHVFS